VQTSRHPYGPHPDQLAELYLPAGRPRAVVVVVHGGFWRARYDHSLGRPLAADLAARGYAAWNLEYRRVGGGGGYPQTFEDVASGIDALAGLGIDLSRVVAVGHSAGGQLASWAAARGSLPEAAPGSGPLVPLTGVIAQAGVLDLTTAARTGVGETAVPDLLGGGPEQVPARYAVADPMWHLPLPVPVACVHAPADANVPFAQSESYVQAAVALGGEATLVRASGDHFTLIDPAHADWRLCLDALESLTR
jgi:acetyl esterase/lipase